MIKVDENLWVGNSHDGEHASVDFVLNVAKDLVIRRGWPTVTYAQVGLVDGPGNLMCQYYGAVLALASLMKTGRRVLVHCHEGRSRSMAVAIMYLRSVRERSWDDILTSIRERVDHEVPDPHQAHREAFDKMNWKYLTEIIKGE